MRFSGDLDSLPRAVLDDILACSLKRQTGVSLKYILDFGTQPLERQMLLSARFLHKELPIRLAHRLMELNNLPPLLANGTQVARVKSWYAQSFQEMRLFPTIKTSEDVAVFTKMLKDAYARHNHVVLAIAKGVEEYKRQLAGSVRAGPGAGGDAPGGLLGLGEPEHDLHDFLDTFFMSRIALRFLAGNHVALFEQAQATEADRPTDRIGLIHTRCSPVQVVTHAVEDARTLCSREYGDAPTVVVHGNPRLTFAYVPSHLHHMVFELVKNSLRAVQDRYDDDVDNEPPPIRLVVAEGGEDVTIKVSDEGGGIPRSGMPKIWTYLYSTAKSPVEMDTVEAAEGPVVLAGYGYGLPISRLYARYFGGDLQIISMEGYGTDAYLHLNRLGNSQEPLP